MSDLNSRKMGSGEQPQTNSMVVTPAPFARADQVQLVELPEGWTIAEMLDHVEQQGVLDPGLRPLVRVTAGDQAVPSHLWECAKPKLGVLLFVDVPPRGSDPVRTVLQVAVILAANFLPGFFGLQGLAAAALAAATAVGGRLELNSLAAR